MTPTVIYHSADYDGIFCREIARRFRPEANLIGWDFGQPEIPFPEGLGLVYVLDLPIECLGLNPFTTKDSDERLKRIVWIDHHKSSIEKWKRHAIAGYRIDGVSACRLAWQWFTKFAGFNDIPELADFKERKVTEPIAVTLAGEYDVWQHENSEGLDITFQFGLDACVGLDWGRLFNSDVYVDSIIQRGIAARNCYSKRDAEIVLNRGFDLDFEGFHFRALNTARCNSQTFEASIREKHDGCLAFYWNGKEWNVSMYGVPHKPNLDFSTVAMKYGGGGHAQACGFRAKTLPWLK